MLGIMAGKAHTEGVQSVAQQQAQASTAEA